MRTLSVSKRDFDAAKELLASEAGLRGFLLWPDTKEEAEVPFSGIDVDLTFVEALEKHSASTVVGKVLRSSDFPSPVKIEAVERIVRVEWRIRPFVTTGLKPTQAIQGRISFLRKFPQRLDKLFKGLSEVAVFEPE